jgi:hypothetical protein
MKTTVSQIIANNRNFQTEDSGIYNKSDYQRQLTSTKQLPTGPLQAITNAIGGTIGTIAGPVGWLGENLASPLTGAERIAGAAKNLALAPVRFGENIRTNTMGSKGILESEKRASEIAKRGSEQALKDYRAGKIDKNTLATRLKAFSGTNEGLKQYESQIASNKEVAGNVIDTLSLLPVGGALGSSLKGINKARIAAKTTGLFKAAEKGAQSALIGKIATKAPGLAKGMSKTGGALTAVGRTGAGKLVGSVETGLIKTGATVEAMKLLGGTVDSNLSKSEQLKLIKDGKLRTAIDIATSMQAAIPFVGSVASKIGETKNIITQGLIRQESLSKIDDYFKGVSKLNNEIPIQGGGSTTARELVLQDFVRYCTQTLQKDVNHIVPDDWERFVTDMTKEKKWVAGDPTQNITHVLTSATGGKINKLEATTQELENMTAKRLTSLEQPQKEVLALPAPTTQGVVEGVTTRGYKPGKVSYKQGSPDFVTEVNGKVVKGPTEKIPVSQKIIPVSKIRTTTLTNKEIKYGTASIPELKYKANEVMTEYPEGKIGQVGNAYGVLQGLPKVELTKVQQKVVNELAKFRETSLGKYFLTKVENGSLMRDIETKSTEKLDSITNGKGDKLMGSLNRVLDRVESKYVPVGNVKNLRQKYVEMALQEAKMPPSMAKQVMQALSDANYEGLKMNGIVSMKSKLATLSPKFNQLDRAYMSARFGLRPFFWLMQTTESTVYGGIMKGDLVHAASKRNYAGIMATKEYGKEAKLVKADMKISGTNEVLEKTVATSEKIKRAKAQALHFTDSLAESLAKTPYGQKFKSVDEIPAFKEYVKGLDEAKDKVSYVQDYIKNHNIDTSKGLAKQGLETKETIALNHAAREAANKAAKKGEPMYLYNTSRSPFERGLHQIMFPASYTKKIVTEGSKWLTKGSGSRVLITNEGLKQYSGLRDRIENAAVDHPQLRPVIALMNVFDPLSTDFPLSIGGATPFYRTIEKMATNPGKYNLKTVKGTNEVIKQLAPNIKEYERYVGFGYNAVGKDEPKYAQSFYPQYLEENRKTAKGKIFNQE